MTFKTYTVLTLLVTSSAAFAWQPLTYPVRSQSPYQRGVDSALCYSEAGRVSKVNIVREPQIPPRPAPAQKGTSTGAPSRPPLPPSSFTATPLPYAASMPDAASEALAALAAPASGASSPRPASGALTGADGARGAATTAAPAVGASAPATTTAGGASAALGASDAASASLQASAASDVKLPPLPAPEPPMTRYWAAYGACMQARGYVVQ